MFRRTQKILFPVFKYARLAIPVVLIGKYNISLSDEFNSMTTKSLSRNFIADAVALASPSVVNIRCNVGGMFGGEASGSGFILSRV